MVNILSEPQSWLYGTQFHLTELHQTAVALSDAGLLFTVGHHPVIQLTARGLLCVDYYDGDPTKMPARI